MSLDKMQQLVGSLAKKVNDNHQIVTPVLAQKISKCLKDYPHDKTLGQMSRVIEGMVSNDTLFITRGDLRGLYHRLHSYNTKFADLFQNELGDVEELPEPVTQVRDDSIELNPYEIADPILSNALKSVFDKIPLKLYSQKLANEAVHSVAITLDSWGVKPTSLKVSDGNDKFLVLKADYETPKGITSLYVPVEVHNNKLANAAVFMGNSGPIDLNYINVKDYVTVNAGKKMKIKGSTILQALVTVSSENRELSDAEMALIKVNASKQGNSAFFQGQIIGQKIVEASIEDVSIPKSPEFQSFEEQFSSSAGLADFKFGKDKINIARDNIFRNLISMGYANSQIVVTGHNDTTVFYSISLDAGKVAFKVPVNIIAGVVDQPTVLICNGAISSFDKSEIDKLYINEQTDLTAAAEASPLGILKASDLVETIRVSLASKDFGKAEDALNVLSNLGDEKAYAMGFQAYLMGLGTKTAEASAECGCNMIIQSNVSKHPVCGHTGLPVNKVYQDAEGNCRPLYRRGMDDSYEGASFMNSKIFG